MTAPSLRVRLVAVGLLVATLLIGCGDKADDGATPAPTTVPTTPAAEPECDKPDQQSAPRWETVTTLRGEGSLTTDAFPILCHAIQWRARWTCSSGHLKVESIPPPRRGDPMIDEGCDGTPADKHEPGYSVATGNVQMKIEASGPWEIVVDQQIDTPLEEPLLEGMAEGKILGEGEFYNMEMTGKGTARLYELPSGKHAVRFENFEVSNNTDLFVWLSESPNPKTSADAVAVPYREIGNLKSTLGNENFLVPDDLPAEKVQSIVIWCAPVRVAYTGAVLARK